MNLKVGYNATTFVFSRNGFLLCLDYVIKGRLFIISKFCGFVFSISNSPIEHLNGLNRALDHPAIHIDCLAGNELGFVRR
jgi:hypothetical protein